MINPYQITAKKRKDQEEYHRKKRWQQAQVVAKQASEFLKTEYGELYILLFGSATELDRFHLTSDIDLAVKGLPPKHFFTAVARLQDLSPEFKIDLVQLEYCQDSLHQLILEEGKQL